MGKAERLNKNSKWNQLRGLVNIPAQAEPIASPVIIHELNIFAIIKDFACRLLSHSTKTPKRSSLHTTSPALNY